MKKLTIISDTNSKSIKIKKAILKKIKSNKFHNPNLIIVIGGDGFMLQTLKKNKNPANKFYGINSGNYGFLMNKFSKNNILTNLFKSKMIKISPLEMKVELKKNGKCLALTVSVRQETSITCQKMVKIYY